MKNSITSINNRRKKILSLIEANQNLTVNELATFLNVTTVTIRKDLDVLASEGRLIRTYGGAKLSYHASNTTIQKQSHRSTNHQRILAKKAAEFINQDEVILINSSKTASYIVEYTNGIPVTVISNNTRLLSRSVDPNTILILSGGQLLTGRSSLSGPYAVDILSRSCASKCFLGVRGISITGGITSSLLEESIINQTMIKQTTGPVIVVAASYKIGRDDSFRICDINKIDILITDEKIRESDRAAFEEIGIKVITVPCFFNN